MAMSEPAVLTRGFTKIFNGQAAVDGLDLEVPRGSVFALLGPNGAGKTTTLKLLLNLLQPTAGDIRVLGLDAVKNSVAVRRRVGYQAETQRFYYSRVRVEELFGMFWAFFWGGGLFAGKFRDGTMEFFLARPVSRPEVYNGIVLAEGIILVVLVILPSLFALTLPLWEFPHLFFSRLALNLLEAAWVIAGFLLSVFVYLLTGSSNRRYAR